MDPVPEHSLSRGSQLPTLSVRTLYLYFNKTARTTPPPLSMTSRATSTPSWCLATSMLPPPPPPQRAEAWGFFFFNKLVGLHTTAATMALHYVKGNTLPAAGAHDTSAVKNPHS